MANNPGGRRGFGLCTLMGLIVLMVAGVFFVQRMWTIHSELRDARNNARHLETLYDEAMDEAADWRHKYDADIKQATEGLGEKDKIIGSLTIEKNSLQQIKDDLEKQLAKLEKELTMEKSKCDGFFSQKLNGSDAV